MLENIFVPYHTRRYAKKKIERKTKSFNEARAIGVICSYKFLINSDQAVDNYIKALRKRGKRVSMMVFHENASDPSGVSKQAFSRQDLSFFGFWKKDQVKAFIDKKFDFLILLDLEYNMFMINVMALSKAHCRIGIYDEEASPYFELMIKPEERSLERLIEGVDEMFEKLSNEG